MNKVRIANPIYDVVFRYLMQDNKVAKLFLSAITGKNIVELTFKPTEHSTKIGESNLTVIRMDFSAKVQTNDGEYHLILIELQKAKHYVQIMRFRRYLGRQYDNPENVVKGENGQRDTPLPILPIYILGDAFTEEGVPVIRVQRDYWDAASEERINQKYEFIEALTHDAIVIQVPHLKEKRRNVLEQFLEIFDQSNKADSNGHILEIVEDDYPQHYQEVIRRLKKAIASTKILEEMDIEDDVLEEFNRLDIQLKKAQEEKQKAQEERQKAQEEKQKIAQQNKKLIQKLYKAGFSFEEIAETANLSVENVKEIIENIMN